MAERKFKPNLETAQQKQQNILEKLSEGVKQLLSSEYWQQYLKMQAKFYNYSFNNCLLIMMQQPGATRVAGYNSWKQLGRYVKKGEKGITILAPLTRKLEQETDKGEIEAVRILSGFRTVSVFDIEQTEGKELLSVCHELKGNDLGLFNLLKTFAKSKNILVNMKLIRGNGYCRYLLTQPVEIAISAELEPLHQAKTLAHELAHALLHTPENYAEHRPDMELEAESVAYVVLNHFNLDSASYSLGYVAHWQKVAGEDMQGTVEKINLSAQVIKQASQEIINWVTKQTTEKIAS